ncbi:MAG: hypothetical protein HC923_02520 [Myxococcales bacterium]|nr:hypothetical protein [Myxococcales bacterium]
MVSDDLCERRARLEWLARQHPTDGQILTRETTRVLEEMVLELLLQAGLRNGLGAPATLTALEPLALGSFGRRDMTPYSDIDLVFLVADEPDERATRIIDASLYALWDSGLRVGHSVRRVAEALDSRPRSARVMSSLLEGRPLDVPNAPIPFLRARGSGKGSRKPCPTSRGRACSSKRSSRKPPSAALATEIRSICSSPT